MLLGFHSKAVGESHYTLRETGVFGMMGGSSSLFTCTRQQQVPMGFPTPL